MIFKKETEEVIEKFIANEFKAENISPEMVRAIAELIRAICAT